MIPENLAVVRSILVVGPYSGGDSRDYHEQVWYREFLNLHGFAFPGRWCYDKSAAERHWERLIALYRRSLG